MSHFLNDVLIRSCQFPNTIVKDAYTRFLAEEHIISLPHTVSNTLKLIKRTLHYATCLSISDQNPDIHNFDAPGSSGIANLGSLATVRSKEYNPDLLIFLPHEVNAHGDRVPKFLTIVDGAVTDTSPEGVHKSQYTIELTCTRGNVEERFADKTKKSYDYVYVFYYGRHIVPQRTAVPILYTGENFICYSNGGMLPGIIEMDPIFGVVAATLNQFTPELESRMSRMPLMLTPHDVSPAYYDHVHHNHQIHCETEEGAYKTIIDSSHEHPGLIEVDFPNNGIANFCGKNKKIKSTYNRFPFAMTTPAIAGVGNPFELMKEIKLGSVLNPGNHFENHINGELGVFGIETYGRRVIQILKSAIFQGKMNRTEDEHTYLVSEVAKDAGVGRGLGYTYDPNLPMADAKFLDFKESNIGNSILLRVLTESYQKLEKPVAYPVLAQTLINVTDCQEKRDCLQVEEYFSTHALFIRSLAFSRLALWMLSASGQFREKRNEKTVKTMVFPVTMGEDNDKILYGYAIIPNAHAKEELSCTYVIYVAFGRDHIYQGMENFSKFDLVHKDLNAVGFTTCYIATTPVTKNKLYNIWYAPRASGMTVSDYGDVYYFNKENGLAAPLLEEEVLNARFCLNLLCHWLDNNALQGASKALTKMDQLRLAKHFESEGYVVEDPKWYDDIYINEGFPAEITDIFMKEFAKEYEFDPRDNLSNDWSWEKTPTLTAAIVGHQIILDPNGIDLDWNEDAIIQRDGRLMSMNDPAQYDQIDDLLEVEDSEVRPDY